MRFLPLLGLAFLAAPLAAATPGPAVPFRAGTTTLTLASVQLTRLDIAIRDTIEGACSLRPPHDTLEPVKSRCLTVCNDPGLAEMLPPSSLTARVLSASPSGGGFHATWRPFSWEAAGKALHLSSCGRVRYGLTIDPSATQPVTGLELWSEPGGGTPKGRFAGTLRIAGRLQLENLDLGTLDTPPIDLEIQVTGSWLAFPPGPGPGIASSGLLLDPSPEGWADTEPSCFNETPQFWIEELGTYCHDRCRCPEPQDLF